MAVALLAASAAGAQAQDWRTLSSARQLGSERSLEVDVEYAAGVLTIRPAPGGVLYDAHMRYDAGVFEPALDYRRGRLVLDLEGEGIRGGNHEPGALDLDLSPDVPLDIDLKFGAGRADVELGGLRIRRASIATGASEAEVRFSRPNPVEADELEVQVGAASFELAGIGNANAGRLTVAGGVGEVTLGFTGAWRRDMRADVKLGLGSLRLVLPRGLGVRVRKGGLLTSFDSQRFTKRGEMFYSEGWEDARHRLTLDIDAAFSSIDVRWVEDPDFAP
ncbi:MAG TPA: hypothetical protein VMK65_10845 [Longimicrobiales bacterium]|nr:hypothetical protein [Longimicrobiales bacterium]